MPLLETLVPPTMRVEMSVLQPARVGYLAISVPSE